MRKLNYKGIASITAIITLPFIINYTLNRLHTAIQLQATDIYTTRWQALLLIEILALASALYYTYNKLK